MPAKVDITDFQRRVRQIALKLGPEAMAGVGETAAAMLLQKTLESPIPSDTHMLARTGAVVRVAAKGKGAGRVRFGFNMVYAAFQDQLNRSGFARVAPVRKKWLYVPLTEAGRKHHRAGANPEAEGLLFGGFFQRIGGGRVIRANAKGETPRTKGKVKGFGTKQVDVRPDYVLAKEVLIRIKKYGSDVGPNHYFSGTIKKWWKRCIEAATARVRAIVEGKNPNEGMKGLAARAAAAQTGRPQ